MATLRVTNLKGRTANIAPDFPDGANMTGVCTATTFVGSLTGTATGLAGSPQITAGISTFSGRVIVGADADPYATRSVTIQPVGGETNTYLSVIGGNTTSVTGITFGDAAGQAAGNYAGMFEYFNDGDYLLYKQNNAERLRITSTGQIGVGVTPNWGNTSYAGIHVHSPDSTNSYVTLTNNATGDTGSSDGFSLAYSSNDVTFLNRESGDLIFSTGGGERFRVTSGGGFSLNNGELVERVKITAGKLSDNTNIDLENGNVHHFTTAESTTSTPNIRVSSSTTLNSVMDVGDVTTVTLITTANASAYSEHITIDGSAVTENWVGGSAPSDGGSSGVDIHAFTIIKTAANTYTVIGNHTKTS